MTNADKIKQMTVCDEMQKLRDYLDKKGIEWRDKSQGEGNELGIERTHFEVGGTFRICYKY